MKDNIFLENQPPVSFEQYLQFDKNGRGNLGEDIPVAVYRLLEYSLREELCSRYGQEMQIDIFRKAGYRAGIFFAETYLDLTLPLNSFISSLQKILEDMKIGVLRIESIDDESGRIMLTVAEDADCSGLPLLGRTVCNYDEGFLSAILSKYTGKSYEAVEIDCWATGDRVCRFRAEVED